MNLSHSIKNIYVRMLELCNTKWAQGILVFFTFIESSFFIIPPETFLLPMCYANRKKAFYYAFITTVSSVSGAILGYYIGAYFWAELGPWFMSNVPGMEKHFDQVGLWYKENAILTIFTAAFTPIPYKVFTVAAGVYSEHISIVLMVIVSIFGRGIRYTLLSGIIYFFGEYAKKWIEKYFTAFTILVCGVMVFAVVIYRFFIGH